MRKFKSYKTGDVLSYLARARKEYLKHADKSAYIANLDSVIENPLITLFFHKIAIGLKGLI